MAVYRLRGKRHPRVVRNLREEILIGTPKGRAYGRFSSVCRKKDIIKMYHEERDVTVLTEFHWLRLKSCGAHGNERQNKRNFSQLTDCQLLESI
jgi:hypothetical protein